MSLPEPATPRRIHIGNISPKLRENGDTLGTRLSKFGTLVKPLEFHTKPVNDFYFAFAEMELNDKQFEKLKAAFNGILYMGRKITIGLAKSDFQQRWAKDSARPGPLEKDVDAKSGISQNRRLRIQEAHAPGPSNRITGGAICKTSIVGANNASLGYMKSAHTFQEMSGNTKHSKPSLSLIGPQSYGASLIPKGPFFQQFSRTSGYGDVVKGRVRKTPRSAAYFVRKQQTMRILVNGELKQIKCFKTKLWGVEKNRTVLDLTYKYVDGSWKSGDDHVVERSEGSKKLAFLQTPPAVKCAISGDQAESYGKLEPASEKPVLANAEEELKVDLERAQNAAILAKLFNNSELEKQTDFDVDDVEEDEAVTYDSKGRKRVQRFDFETQGTLLGSDSEEDEAYPENDAMKMDIVEEFRSSTERPPDEVYYSESDEGNELDMDALHQQYTTEAIKTQYDEEHDAEESE